MQDFHEDSHTAYIEVEMASKQEVDWRAQWISQPQFWKWMDQAMVQLDHLFHLVEREEADLSRHLWIGEARF